MQFMHTPVRSFKSATVKHENTLTVLLILRFPQSTVVENKRLLIITEDEYDCSLLSNVLSYVLAMPSCASLGDVELMLFSQHLYLVELLQRCHKMLVASVFLKWVEVIDLNKGSTG